MCDHGIRPHQVLISFTYTELMGRVTNSVVFSLAFEKTKYLDKLNESPDFLRVYKSIFEHNLKILNATKQTL